IVRLARPLGDLRFFLGEHSGELGDVRADDEYRLAGGDHQTLDSAFAANRVDGLLQVFQCSAVELVDRLALKVELQFGDAVVKQLSAYGVTLVNHIDCSPVPKSAAVAAFGELVFTSQGGAGCRS